MMNTANLTIEEKLKSIENTFLNIQERKCSSDIKNYAYARLMTRMERDFKIPYLNDEEWNKNHVQILSLYRKIADARELS